MYWRSLFFFFQAEDGIRDLVRSRGLGDVYKRQAPNYSPITKAAGIPNLKEERSTNFSLGASIKPAQNITFSIDAYRVKVKDRVVLSGQFSADDETLNETLRNTLRDLKVSYAQFFANAVNTTNSGVDVVLDLSLIHISEPTRPY